MLQHGRQDCRVKHIFQPVLGVEAFATTPLRCFKMMFVHRTLTVVLVASVTFVAWSQSDGPSACSAILAAGVYNEFSQSNAGTSFASLTASLCQDYSSYSYE
jgi:hypothetical protein